jgi:hypothetical protein
MLASLGERVVVEPDQGVPFLLPGAHRRPARLDADYQHPAVGTPPALLQQAGRQRHGLHRGADPAPPHPTVADQPAGDELPVREKGDARLTGLSTT